MKACLLILLVMAGIALADEDSRQLVRMPPAMHQLGIDGHRAASAFARIAASGDREKTLAALPTLTQACVACHHAYRLH